MSSTVILIGIWSFSHLSASVAWSVCRSVNSYVSHSWYSHSLGFTVTRSWSSAGLYQKAPHDLEFFEKMTVHSSLPAMKNKPYEPAGSSCPSIFTGFDTVKTVFSLAPPRHGHCLQSLYWRS